LESMIRDRVMQEMCETNLSTVLPAAIYSLDEGIFSGIKVF